MDNHEMLIRQRRDMSLVQNQQLVIRHGQGLVVGQNHNIGLGPHSHKHDIKLGQSHNQDMHLEHSHGYGHDRELLLNHDDDNRHDNGYDEIDEEDDLDRGIDRDQDRTKSHDSHLVLSDQAPLGLSDSNGLAVVNNHELDENLDLGMHPHPEMGMVPLTAQHPDLVVTTPVIQSRTLAPSPNYELMVGQEFPDVTSCRRALRHTAIALHFEIQTVKSDKTRFTAKCASEGCPWRIHAAKLPGVPTFTIRTIHGDHTCGGIAHLGHQQASVQWIAYSVEQRLKENPQCKPKEILEEIHRVHGITLSYKQAWRGKERIMAALRGSFEEDYRLLPQYCDQVRRTNPDSIASVYVNPSDNCFQRLFISFQASIYGFLNACRPLLGLDSTVLKSKYLGTLLFATGFDGDGALFPLAFGVVDEENNDNWMWFLSELHNLLEINTENMPRLTILSDRQKSIVDGVEANFPTAFHGFCMHHLSESFRKEFNNTMLINLLWDAANALTVMEFESKILEIEEISQEAAYWIRRVPARLWATAYFEGTRFGHLKANIVESLNVWILEASGLPIIQMMECIRRQLMTWFNERREASMQWTSILVPTAERRVLEAIDRAQTYQVLKANEAEFEVISHEGTNIVDIRNRCCLCRGWQLYGLPCAHAVAALLSCRQNVHRFTESCFTVATYRKAYSQTIHPVPDKNLWKEMLLDGVPQGEGSSSVTEIIVNPPKSLRPPERPRKRRVRSEDRGRVKRIVHCSRCNQTAAMHIRFGKISNQKIIPWIRVSKTRQPLKMERFPDYVARQMGFDDNRECPYMCKLASDYIRKEEGCEEEMYSFFADNPQADSLFIKLIEEFERCILSYFAFHWSHASFMISQVLGPDGHEPKKKLKNIVMQATREQRFERVTKNLKVARVFTTLVEEMKAIGLVSADDSQCTDVMVPMAHKDRSPLLLFMGGGMGVGKSTVLKDLLKEPFWAGASANAVVIEADAFKESDVIYRALSKRGHHDMLHTAELVHQSSTDAAASLLVTALNEGRDVIMDGTLSWVPFVVQTITMARNVHRKRYRMGPGYKVNLDGSVIENYWEQLEEESELVDGNQKRRPYRIELVGVVCDPYLAVIRGIRRAVMCRRAVRVRSQLTSHKRFAKAFVTYCQLVDNARLYLTNALEGPPKLIGWKDKEKTLLVDPDEIKILNMLERLNETADSIYELYKKPSPANEQGSVWKDIVMSPTRLSIQKELKYAVQKAEVSK